MAVQIIETKGEYDITDLKGRVLAIFSSLAFALRYCHDHHMTITF